MGRPMALSPGCSTFTFAAGPGQTRAQTPELLPVCRRFYRYAGKFCNGVFHNKEHTKIFDEDCPAATDPNQCRNPLLECGEVISYNHARAIFDGDYHHLSRTFPTVEVGSSLIMLSFLMCLGRISKYHLFYDVRFFFQWRFITTLISLCRLL
jgi:hypothetical protein